VLIVLLVCCSCGNADKNPDTSPSETNNGSSVITTSQITEPSVQSMIEKEDSKKDWVYDANYNKEVSTESYTTNFGETYFVKDIVVPYININSPDAIKANVEIEKIFNTAIKVFNEGTKDKLSYVDDCSYKVYINDKVLSVVITLGTGATDVIYPNYHTYNFDLTTGKIMSFEDIYSIAGFTATDVNSKIKDVIKTKTKSIVASPETQQYENQSIENYETALKDNTLQYYLGENKELYIVTELSFDAGKGCKNFILEVNN
jgi:hypothetical protein